MEGIIQNEATKEESGDAGDDGVQADLLAADHEDLVRREQASPAEASQTMLGPTSTEENEANPEHAANLKGERMDDKANQRLEMRKQQNEAMLGNNGVLNAENIDEARDHNLVDMQENLYLNIVVPSAVQGQGGRAAADQAEPRPAVTGSEIQNPIVEPASRKDRSALEVHGSAEGARGLTID